MELTQDVLRAKMETVVPEMTVDRDATAERVDTGQGCPQAATSYTQLPTLGYRVILIARGKVSQVSMDGGKAVLGTMRIQGEVMGSEPPPVSPLSNPALEKLVTQAKNDLGKRLSVKPDRIELIELKAVVWPDTSLGCPQPGMEYLQVPCDGALIRLRVGKRTYDYHSGSGRVPFLCERAGKKSPDRLKRSR